MAKKKCYYKDCYDNNIKWDSEYLINFHGKNYCRKHYPRVKKESDDRTALINYLKLVFNVTYPTGLVLGQIKKFHDDLGYSYEGIKDAVELIQVTPSLVLDNSRGIGIVPWYYEKAQDLKNRKIQNNSDNEVHKTVHIKESTLKNSRKKEELFDFSNEDL